MNYLIGPPFSPPSDVQATEVMAELLAECGRGPGARMSQGFYSQEALSGGRAVVLWTLMEPNGAEFVSLVYEELLGRAADTAALAHYEAGLKQGGIAKIDIIAAIRYSPEGRKISRKVPGLLPRTLLRRSYQIPLLGKLARLAVSILRLPRLANELQSATRRLADVQDRLDRLERRLAGGPLLDARLQQVEGRLGAVEAAMPARTDR